MMKKYDALYIFVDQQKDEANEQLVERVSEEITKLGGELIGSESLGKRNFARPMKKRESGTYIRIRFQISPTEIDTLRARYAIMDEIFRVEILSVDERREELVIEQRARRQAKAEAAANEAALAEAEREAEE